MIDSDGIEGGERSSQSRVYIYSQSRVQVLTSFLYVYLYSVVCNRIRSLITEQVRPRIDYSLIMVYLMSTLDAGLKPLGCASWFKCPPLVYYSNKPLRAIV